MAEYVSINPHHEVPRERLPYLVLKLPSDVRDLLALGPEPEDTKPFGCRVCTALDPLMGEGNRTAELIFDYHDTEGTEGDAAYRRCCDIYEAAGWKGER